jgi:hypothetical protein
LAKWIRQPTVAPVQGAGVTEADTGVGEVGTPGVAETDTGDIVEEAITDVGDTADPAQSGLTAEQQVDAELARILGEDSPLLAQARAEAARMANKRGLMNTSMAAGMTQAEITKAALPMAQQNAQQAFQRELENARMRQESGLFTAEQLTRLRSLEAELGQELSIFNAEQLNQAERLSAEMRTALEQGNQQAYNEAALQLAELQRDAQAQQAEIDYAGAEREFLERQAYNEQIIDSVTELNKQFMSGEQLIDIEHVRGTYQMLMNQNDFAADLYDSYMGAIGQIFDDPKMTTSQAGEAIRALVDAMEGSLRMMSEINGIDLRDLGGAVPGAGEPTDALLLEHASAWPMDQSRKSKILDPAMSWNWAVELIRLLSATAIMNLGSMLKAFMSPEVTASITMAYGCVLKKAALMKSTNTTRITRFSTSITGWSRKMAKSLLIMPKSITPVLDGMIGSFAD